MRMFDFSGILLALITLTTSAAWAGIQGAPELDSTALTGVVSGVAGIYIVYRFYSQAKKR